MTSPVLAFISPVNVLLLVLGLSFQPQKKSDHSDQNGSADRGPRGRRKVIAIKGEVMLTVRADKRMKCGNTRQVVSTKEVIHSRAKEILLLAMSPLEYFCEQTLVNSSENIINGKTN